MVWRVGSGASGATAGSFLDGGWDAGLPARGRSHAPSAAGSSGRAAADRRGYAVAVPSRDQAPPAPPPGPRPGPAELVLVRHGESVGNIADRQARERGEGRLTL